jgi:hypothetical protein
VALAPVFFLCRNKYSFETLRKIYLIILLFFTLGVDLEAQTARPALSGTDQPKVRLYPNPAVSYVQVDWNPQLRPARILVVNGVTGKQMVAASITSNSLRLNVSDFVPGLYVFRMFSANGTYLGGATFQVSK